MGRYKNSRKRKREVEQPRGTSPMSKRFYNLRSSTVAQQSSNNENNNNNNATNSSVALNEQLVPIHVLDDQSVPTRVVDDQSVPTRVVDDQSVPTRVLDDQSVPTRVVDDQPDQVESVKEEDIGQETEDANSKIDTTENDVVENNNEIDAIEIKADTTIAAGELESQNEVADYDPELNENENPFYFNKNKLLHELHLERLKRCSV